MSKKVLILVSVLIAIPLISCTQSLVQAPPSTTAPATVEPAPAVQQVAQALSEMDNSSPRVPISESDEKVDVFTYTNPNNFACGVTGTESGFEITAGSNSFVIKVTSNAKLLGTGRPIDQIQPAPYQTYGGTWMQETITGKVIDYICMDNPTTPIAEGRINLRPGDSVAIIVNGVLDRTIEVSPSGFASIIQ